MLLDIFHPELCAQPPPPVAADDAFERNSNELCGVMVREGAAQGSFQSNRSMLCSRHFEAVCLSVLEAKTKATRVRSEA